MAPGPSKKNASAFETPAETTDSPAALVTSDTAEKVDEAAPTEPHAADITPVEPTGSIDTSDYDPVAPAGYNPDYIEPPLPTDTDETSGAATQSPEAAVVEDVEGGEAPTHPLYGHIVEPDTEDSGKPFSARLADKQAGN